MSVTAEAKERLVSILAQYYTKAGQISDVTQHIRAVTGYTVGNSEPGVACTIAKVGKRIPGKDLAISK